MHVATPDQQHHPGNFYFCSMYAIVDIETTGSNAGYSSITEVAIFIYDGTKVTETWTSLINPQNEIPLFIQQMTGITNEMVAGAPLFEEVAEEIYSLLHPCIFVAHNAGFDYGFLKAHLYRCGYALQSKKLCTVRLSRKIFPGLRSYSLGRLCESLGIENTSRHRAAGDAGATVLLFEKLLRNDPGDFIGSALKRGTREQHLPPHMDRNVLEQLPDRPGVYYFHDASGKVIYVGKAKNIRSRVFGHFTYADSDGKENALRDAVHTISFDLTGNELIALLLESEEIKRKFPRFNNAQKKWDRNYCIFTFTDQRGYRHLAIERYSVKKEVLRVYPDLLSARSSLNATMHAFELCGKFCHLQAARHACYNHELGLCMGACIGLETPEMYNQRVAGAMDSFRQEDASYCIIGKGRADNEMSVIAVEKGHYLGFGFFDPEFTAQDFGSLRDCIKWRPDTPDVQRILNGWLAREQANRSYKLIRM